VLLGDGVRLFDDSGGGLPELERASVLDTPAATHLTYRVAR
jgi:hypothetical protein